MEPPEDDLPYLLMRSSVLKRQLVEYVNEPRFDRHLTPRLAEATSPDGTLTESALIDVLDEFIMRYRFQSGGTVIDRFLRSRGDIDPADREMLLRWRDPVDGIFELLRIEDEASILLNLIDKLEYRVYSNTGQTVVDLGTDVAFVSARLVPLTETAWVISGMVLSYGRDAAVSLARKAKELAAQDPALVPRNQEKLEPKGTGKPADDLKIPVANRPRAAAIIEVTDRVCAQLLNDEYAALACKAVAKLARKRPSPISSGKPATWAGGVVYALGQINFLFDPASRPSATTDDLGKAFGVAKSTLSAKAKQVRDLLKLDYGSADFLFDAVVDASPMVWFISVDGLIMDARQLSLAQQTAAFRQGVIPYIPALGRAGTAEWLRRM